MTTTVRYPWMFRAAAVVYLLLGACVAWSYGFTGYDVAHRPWGVGIGVLAIVVGVFLLRRARWAIGLSAIGAAIVAILAAIGVPLIHGPPILFFAAVAIVFGLYAAMAGRVMLDRGA